MYSPTNIASGFLETFDRSAVKLFRCYLARHPGVSKWLIAADFALNNPGRPRNCFAFSLVPYDDWPDGIEADVTAVLPKDLKKTKTLSPEAAAWLRDMRRFHIAVTTNKNHKIFSNGPDSDSLKIAREHIDLTVNALTAPQHADTLERFKIIRQKSLAKKFNVELLADIWMLGVLYATLTILLGRERTCQIIGWFPDRDNITNFCNGIWCDYAVLNMHAFCEAFEVDLRKTRIGVGIPDRSGPIEDMWFDYMIRAPDWFAGTVAAWDKDNNRVPGEHAKYRKMLEDVVANARNIVILHIDIEEQKGEFRRVVVETSKGGWEDSTDEA